MLKVRLPSHKLLANAASDGLERALSESGVFAGAFVPGSPDPAEFSCAPAADLPSWFPHLAKCISKGHVRKGRPWIEVPAKELEGIGKLPVRQVCAGVARVTDETPEDVPDSLWVLVLLAGARGDNSAWLVAARSRELLEGFLDLSRTSVSRLVSFDNDKEADAEITRRLRDESEAAGAASDAQARAAGAEKTWHQDKSSVPTDIPLIDDREKTRAAAAAAATAKKAEWDSIGDRYKGAKKPKSGVGVVERAETAAEIEARRRAEIRAAARKAKIKDEGIDGLGAHGWATKEKSKTGKLREVVEADRRVQIKKMAEAERAIEAKNDAAYKEYLRARASAKRTPSYIERTTGRRY